MNIEAIDAEDIRKRIVEWAAASYEHLNNIWADAGQSDRSTWLLREYERIREDAFRLVVAP